MRPCYKLRYDFIYIKLKLLIVTITVWYGHILVSSAPLLCCADASSSFILSLDFLQISACLRLYKPATSRQAAVLVSGALLPPPATRRAVCCMRHWLVIIAILLDSLLSSLHCAVTLQYSSRIQDGGLGLLHSTADNIVPVLSE
jgi:hypothetical protein